jgi:hypothetical protein
MKEAKNIFDKILKGFVSEVGGSHSTLMFSADEVIEILEKILDNNLKRFSAKKETKL